MTQAQAVKEIIRKLGGVVTLKEIYKHIHEIKDCNWGTKTPEATIRRIVQTDPDIIRLKAGHYCLAEYRDKLVLEKYCTQPSAVTIVNVNCPGTNFIAHVENLQELNTSSTTLHGNSKSTSSVITSIPDELNDPEIVQLLNIAHKEGWLDTNYQPVISRTKAAILANQIGILCDIKPRWRPFEKLWHREHLCKDYDKAQHQPSTGEIELEIKRKLKHEASVL